MRDIKVIEADIAKLQAELQDAKDRDSMRNAAVHILKNLGWTWTRSTGWKKPVASYKVFDKNTMSHIKAGDWVRIDTGFTGGYGYVRSTDGVHARVSIVRKVTPMGASVQESTRLYHWSHLKVVSHEEIVKNFK